MRLAAVLLNALLLALSPVGSAAATLVTNVAVVLFALGATLGAISFVMWWRNRHALQRLNAFLAEQARIGLDALEAQQNGA